ncbi:MAG TPA: hypothetical protein VHZ25_17860 [Acidobacteriaceae bacterium]|jgi:hypothetical protein|nr:hypothetical protein [Acidobacteriaceae bacterium]
MAGINTPIWDLVVADMQQRNEFGKRQHGDELVANNGSDTLQDAYEEALDLAVYLRKLIHEGELREEADAIERAEGEGMIDGRLSFEEAEVLRGVI